jgi:hypothetical protein
VDRRLVFWIPFVLISGLFVIWAYRIEPQWVLSRNDYSKLQEFLKASQWEAADVETSRLILSKASGRNRFQLFRSGVSFSEFANFPCEDLITIDRLWLKYSNNYFGLSVQQSTWQPTDGSIPAQQLLSNLNRFRAQIGWGNHAPYRKTYSLAAPRGHLPSSRWLIGETMPLIVKPIASQHPGDTYPLHAG